MTTTVQEEIDLLLDSVYAEYPRLPPISGQDPAGLLLLAEYINSEEDYRFKAAIFAAAAYAGAWYEWDADEDVYHFFTARSGMIGAHDPLGELDYALQGLGLPSRGNSALVRWNGVYRQPYADEILEAYAHDIPHPLVAATSHPDLIREWHQDQTADPVAAVKDLLRSAQYYRQPQEDLYP